MSVFWDNAIKRCVLTLAVDGNGTWEELTFVGRESFNMDWYSDEFADLTYREYCEKVFDALGIENLAD
ncbi:MAG: hypothetical protein K6E51_03645 [Treponema sp.]|nr:hypothetical protein [Treponema sp.]